MDETQPDSIDTAAELSRSDPRFALRRRRPDFVAGAQACRSSVLTPQNDLGLSRPLRAALARRMVAHNADIVLLAQYDELLEPLVLSSGETALARGDEPETLPAPLDTIARHADLVTIIPRDANADDIRRLSAAGLTNPQIVALSELIAYVNFQARIIVGLRLLGPSR